MVRPARARVAQQDLELEEDTRRPTTERGKNPWMTRTPPIHHLAISRSKVGTIVMQSSDYTGVKPSVETKSSLEGMVENVGPWTMLRAHLEMIDTEHPLGEAESSLGDAQD
ncbi:hypothetical protein B296_00028401 [Ensete ventricosum]|uniref:Uncharacterized protein n=1 Tax=Ensete ventricosum TaxID=4639 RepID=A0A426YH82_ENSVE|nr:hypothetical protein B296_00028401 [Ensete ventricosum]